MSSDWERSRVVVPAGQSGDDQQVFRLNQLVADLRNKIKLYNTVKDTAEFRGQVKALRSSASIAAQECLKSLRTLGKTVSQRKLTAFDTIFRVLTDTERQIKDLEDRYPNPAAVTVSNPIRPNSRTGLTETFDGDVHIDIGGYQTTDTDQSNDIYERERKEELTRMLRDLQTLQGMVGDVATMVNAHQPMVATIYDNTSAAASNVDDGTEQLGIARRILSSIRAKKCVCLIICLVIVAVIVAILCGTLIPRGGTPTPTPGP